jgi:hypothetical protein
MILLPIATPSLSIPMTRGRKVRRTLHAEKQDILKRLNSIEGHLKNVRKMVEEDQYCVDILRQTYAVRSTQSH